MGFIGPQFGLCGVESGGSASDRAARGVTGRMPEGFIPKHGGYKSLLTFKKAEIVFDATYHFCNRFVDPRSRTTDQMIQAARSGKQNIVEGSIASGTSKETEIKLTNVARGSLEELLNDYRDYLRVHKVQIWDKNSPEAQEVRRLAKATDASYTSFEHLIENGDVETAANTIICLICQTTYLLDRQIRTLEEEFLKSGGLRERMTRARLNNRRHNGDP